MRQHIGMKLDETHLTHFFQVSQVQMFTCLRTHENYHYVTRFLIASCFNFGLSLYLSQIVVMGEIMVKGTKGTKVKVLFPRIVYDTCHYCINLHYQKTPPFTNTFSTIIKVENYTHNCNLFFTIGKQFLQLITNNVEKYKSRVKFQSKMQATYQHHKNSQYMPLLANLVENCSINIVEGCCQLHSTKG